MPFNDDEFVPGLVVFIDPQILTQDPRTKNNVDQTPEGDYSVKDGHFFILLDKREDGLWLMAPVFSVGNIGREPLDEDLQTGFVPRWREQKSHVAKWQHWLAPVSAIHDAALNDDSPSDDRRRYDNKIGRHVARLVGFADANRNPFHRPNPL